MPSRPDHQPPAADPVRGRAWLGPPLAAFAVLFALSAFQADRPAAAETAFLALWSAAVLLPVSALDRGGWAPCWGAVLAVLVVWALPAGAARGSVLAVLLVSVTVRAIVRAGPDPGVAGSIAAALAAQMLFAGDRLIGPLGVGEWIELFASPALAGAALAVLSRRSGWVAWVAAAAVVSLGSGWTPGSLVAWVAVALAVEVTSQDWTRWFAGLAGAVLVWGLVVETRSSAAALLVAGLIWLWRSSRPEAPRPLDGRTAQLGIAGLAVAGAVGGWLASLQGAGEVAGLLAWLPLLVPAAVPSLLSASGGDAERAAVRVVFVLAVSVAAFAAALATPGADGLAAPAAALALGLGGRRLGLLIPQAVWSGALWGSGAILAAYPWLRPAAVAEALGWWELTPPHEPRAWIGAGALVTAVALVAAAFSGWRKLSVPAAAGLCCLLLTGALWAGCLGRRAPSPVALETVSGALASGSPRLEVDLAESPALSRVSVSSHLSNGASLEPGREVATVRLLGADGESVASWPLRAGIGTGEWAARRPDVAALPGLEVPEHWQVWVAKDPANGRFFGQRYRSVFSVGKPVPVTRLVVERSESLPDDVVLTVHELGVAR